MEFYLAAFADHPNQFVTYDDLRRRGDLLDKEALKAIGLHANVKLSAQFLATLNESGRADPLAAACAIGSAISNALSTLRDLSNMDAAGIAQARLNASVAAAGPCNAAAQMEGQIIQVSDAPILPLATCSHPGQCACFYQSWLR
jgi:hypothetical protein